jgi:Zn-dependent protease
MATTEVRQAEARPRRRASLRIGRVAGIDIRVHATFTLLVAFVVATAAPPGGPTITGHLVWLVLLFGAITVHELAHGVVARRYGSPVQEIDLLPIGGVSRLGRLPDDPHQQLRIALAGPLASIAIGAGAGTLALAAGADLWPPDIFDAPLIARLAWVNLILAGFNLLPAFPMDGGRALRAWLALRMDGDRATAIAASAGRRIALGMIIGGLLANLWLLLIGVFVYAGSRVEETSAVVQRALDDVRVRDVMVDTPPATPSDPLATPVDADERLLDTDLLTADFDSRPVVRRGEIVGYVVEDDLTRRMEERIAEARRRYGRRATGRDAPRA